MSDFLALLTGAVVGFIYFDELWEAGETMGRRIGEIIVAVINQSYGDQK